MFPSLRSSHIRRANRCSNVHTADSGVLHAHTASHRLLQSESISSPYCWSFSLNGRTRYYAVCSTMLVACICCAGSYCANMPTIITWCVDLHVGPTSSFSTCMSASALLCVIAKSSTLLPNGPVYVALPNQSLFVCPFNTIHWLV